MDKITEQYIKKIELLILEAMIVIDTEDTEKLVEHIKNLKITWGLAEYASSFFVINANFIIRLDMVKGEAFAMPQAKLVGSI